jgi:hypothetical protein
VYAADPRTLPGAPAVKVWRLRGVEFKAITAWREELHPRGRGGLFSSDLGGGLRTAQDSTAAGMAPPEMLSAARAKAAVKARAVPKPSAETLAKYREAAVKIKAGKLRPGGEFRGNSAARRRSRENLLKEFGDGTTAPCVYCGVLLGAGPPPPPGQVQRDKIITFSDGGGYQLPNLVPACASCNASRNDAVFPFGLPDWKLAQDQVPVEAKAAIVQGAGGGGPLRSLRSGMLVTAKPYGWNTVDSAPVDVDVPDPTTAVLTGALEVREVPLLAYTQYLVLGVPVDRATIVTAESKSWCLGGVLYRT